MHRGKRRCGRIGSARQRGVTTIEYAVVTVLFVLALIASPNVIPELMDALKRVYQAFTYAISVSYPPVSPGDII